MAVCALCCLCLAGCPQPVEQGMPAQAGETSSAVSETAAPAISSAVQPGLFRLEDGFTSEPVPADVQQRMLGKSYPENCDVPFEDLRYLRMDHIGFDGETHRGEMVVNKTIAGAVLEIFAALYKAGYPIEKMVLVDEYNADDEASMADNNTSGFCFRAIAGTGNRSYHADGLAIDINPLYNPYVKNGSVSPANAAQYADRTLDNPYYITAESLPYQLFTERGFGWGGDWEVEGMFVKDYQHFSFGDE